MLLETQITFGLIPRIIFGIVVGGIFLLLILANILNKRPPRDE